MNKGSFSVGRYKSDGIYAGMNNLGLFYKASVDPTSRYVCRNSKAFFDNLLTSEESEKIEIVEIEWELKKDHK